MSAVRGLDTNVLVRYYVSDATDVATQRQRELARDLIESGEPLAVCATVVLELEWVLRGYYKLPRARVLTALRHLLSLPHIRFDDRRVLQQAIENYAAGLDFADALHHANYAACASVLSFDDRGFAQRSSKLNLSPAVVLPR